MRNTNPEMTPKGRQENLDTELNFLLLPYAPPVHCRFSSSLHKHVMDYIPLETVIVFEQLRASHEESSPVSLEFYSAVLAISRD
mmetsp:Transcript_16876/g.68930  ORF Transcript_16876/g.68930 Transcript_16876/m.68930 type:complete len:84 (-) Transcript_16876:1118-1369(-)